jgi:hypothetical protein
MTTNEQQAPRELSVIIGLQTYQGMTDEEINLILNYRIETEVRKRISEGNKAVNIIQMEAMIDQNKESSTTAMDVLKSILNRKPILNTVEESNE